MRVGGIRPKEGSTPTALSPSPLPPSLPTAAARPSVVQFFVCGVQTARAMGDVTECAVCLEPVAPGGAMCRTECGHVFHSACAFRAVREDPRCSICRQRLAPERAPKVTEGAQYAIEIDGMDFSEFSSGVQRARRNYHARRRRAERKDASIAALRDQWRQARKDVGECDAKLDRMYSEEMREICKRPEIRALRAFRSQMMRKEQRLNRQYHAVLEERVGQQPLSPLEQLLAQNDPEAPML